MDGRRNNGAKKGVKQGQGRPPKSDELALAEKLRQYEPAALEAIENGVKKGDFQFIKLFMEYLHGKPKETIYTDSEMTVIVKKVKRPMNES